MLTQHRASILDLYESAWRTANTGFSPERFSSLAEAVNLPWAPAARVHKSPHVAHSTKSRKDTQSRRAFEAFLNHLISVRRRRQRVACLRGPAVFRWRQPRPRWNSESKWCSNVEKPVPGSFLTVSSWSASASPVSTTSGSSTSRSIARSAARSARSWGTVSVFEHTDGPRLQLYQQRYTPSRRTTCAGNRVCSVAGGHGAIQTTTSFNRAGLARCRRSEEPGRRSPRQAPRSRPRTSAEANA